MRGTLLSPGLMALTLLLGPLLFRGARLTRGEGMVVLVGYAAYMVLLL